MRRLTLATLALLSTVPAALAEEPVVGNWKTANGHTAKIGPCGDAYCIVIQDGEFKGRQIGRMSGSGGSYSGEITDPKAEKTYAGSATVTGGALKLTGCALKIFCKSQTWTKL